MKNKLLTISCALALAFTFQAEAQVTKEKLEQDCYAGVGIYHTYRHGNLADTPAPEGYEPFYISHLGRHGSRYHSERKAYLRLAKIFDEAMNRGLLTEKGKELYSDISLVDSLSAGDYGDLTSLGKKEHKEIAERMYGRFPEVFRNDSRRHVQAYSSTVGRCQESMMSFTKALHKKDKSLVVDVHSGDSYMKYLLNKPSNYKEIVHIAAPQVDSLAYAWLDFSRFMGMIFTDVDKADALLSGRYEFVREIYIWIGILPCMGVYDVPMTDWFTGEELFELARLNAGRVYSEMCNSRESDGRRAALADKTLKDFIEKADAALDRKSCMAADLRFAHDVTVMPLAGLIGLEGCDVMWPVEEVWKHWLTADYTPMAANLQMIFYKKPGSREILVKFLFNEEEKRVPALKPVEGPYYEWKTLRKYLESRLAYAASRQ